MEIIWLVRLIVKGVMVVEKSRKKKDFVSADADEKFLLKNQDMLVLAVSTGVRKTQEVEQGAASRKGQAILITQQKDFNRLN